MKKFLGTAFLLALAFAPARSDASTICTGGIGTSCVFTFNSSQNFSGGPWGTVTLNLIAANQAEFIIDLVGSDTGQDARLIDTGAHESFALNYSGPGTLTFSGFLANGSPTSVYAGQLLGTYNNSPFGSFNYALSASCTGGSPCAGAGNVVRFVATSSAASFTNGLGDLINLTTGNGFQNVYFAADIYYSIGGQGGNTGAIGTYGDPRITQNNVPEPQSAALLGTGLLGLAFAAKRMRRK